MGQYHIPVNLDKREFVFPHRLGAGLKLWEQLANHPGTGAALIILTAVSNGRGGGDLRQARPDVATPGMDLPSAIASAVAAEGRQATVIDPDRIIGRWGGDRIAIVGDYAEDYDLPLADRTHLIYSLCDTPAGLAETITWRKERADEARAGGHDIYGTPLGTYEADTAWLETQEPFTDISDAVATVIATELGGRYEGEGWRKFRHDDGRYLFVPHEEVAKGSVTIDFDANGWAKVRS
jgi:hypothetical protein